jgi:hypothetical protein
MEKQKPEIKNFNFGQKHALLIGVYTGIDQSQLSLLLPNQKQKIYFGLIKQLELVASLHLPKAGQPPAKDILKSSLTSFIDSNGVSTEQLVPELNSILLFGEIKEVKNTPAESLHNELSHFWRILGWEELSEITQKSKHIPGTLDDVEANCGNLIRTLTLLNEYWEELNIGPKPINPEKNIKTMIESTDGYALVKQLNYPNALAIVTGRDKGYPKLNGKEDYKEKTQLLEQLLTRFPAEFAFMIFEYYSFAKGWSTENYNAAVVQEYIDQQGQHKIKGFASGRFTFLLTEEGKTSLVTSSDSHVPVGSPDKTKVLFFDIGSSPGNILSIVHGETARFISRFPGICLTLTGNKNQLINLSSALGVAHEKKPIVTISIGKAVEKQTTDINEDEINRALSETVKFIRGHKIQTVSLEAGHIHADRKPTKLQRQGITIGAKLFIQLENMGINVKKQPMIDEDHVINTFNYKDYLNLMYSLGYEAEELIFESSPVIREIAIASIISLLSKYPENFSMNGNALIFNVPNTQLQVEFIRDITEPVFELGCVIFDVGLSLYKAFPELEYLYSNVPGKNIHQEMLEIYNENTSPVERLKRAKEKFPVKTETYSELESHEGLPQLPSENIAVCNILEGFYGPQQEKLKAVLTSLGVDLYIIGVSITDQGLKVSLN